MENRFVPPLAPIIRSNNRGRPVAKFSAGHYQILASAIRQIQDETMRLAVADHFAKFFNDRSNTFDPMAWERSTGGKLTRDNGG